MIDLLSWDMLIATSTASLTFAILPTLLNPLAYVPRWTSALFAVGITGIAVGLLGNHLYMSAVINLTSVVIWVVVFVLRGRKI